MDGNSESKEQKTDSRTSSNNDSWLFWAAIVALFIILVSYFCNFYNSWSWSNVFSKETDSWGQFADFVGGLMNPFLSIIVLWTLIKTLRLNSEAVKHASDAVSEAKTSRTEEENRLKRQNTMDVYSQFHFKEMVESRNIADNTLNKINKEINFWDLHFLKHKIKPAEFEHTIMFLSFFEKVNIMKKNELIDEKLLYSFFFRYYQPFYGAIELILGNTPSEGEWTSLLVEVAELHWWFKERGILSSHKN